MAQIIINGIDNKGLTFDTYDIEFVIQDIIEEKIKEDLGMGYEADELGDRLYVYGEILNRVQDAIKEHIEQRIKDEKKYER